MKEQADQQGITSIALPKIGTGYGGLSWKKVKVIIEKVFGDWPGTLYVYEEYTPEEGESASDETTKAAKPRSSPARVRPTRRPKGK